MQHLPVEYTEAAKADLETIFVFVLERSRNPQVAIHYTDRIYDRCERIGDVPRGGIARPDLGEGIRMVPFERSAVILYRLTDDAVEIVNVFYGGRDYEAIMGPE